MITVPQATKKIIERSRYLSEAIAKNIINLSSLARYIKPEIDAMLIKNVSEASILMALKRLSNNLKPPVYKNLFLNPPDIILHSNLLHMSISNSEKSSNKIQELQKHCLEQQKFFLTAIGISETIIIISRSIATFKNDPFITNYTHVAAITIKLPREALRTSGIFYFLLKSLAWEEINIIEVISMHLELSIILEEKQAQQAFSILQSLFIKDQSSASNIPSVALIDKSYPV